jgi:hypothetical protein
MPGWIYNSSAKSAAKTGKKMSRKVAKATKKPCCSVKMGTGNLKNK